MKFIKIIYTAVAALILGSCSSDYLDTAPQSSTSPSQIFSTTENARLAVNGMCRLMISQWLGTQGMNGEGTIQLYYGEYAGNDYANPSRTNRNGTMQWVDMNDNSSIYATYPWQYYYTLISNANTLLSKIDGATGPQTERDFIKAQGLVFRAYSYFQLTQIFCRRWSDTNGESRGVPLRLEPTLDAMPASTLAKVYGQIYQDLEDAIALFKSSGLDRAKGNTCEPNLNVAYGVFSRAALTRQDWAKAAEMSALAREGYKLCTIDEYCSGFNKANSEWIWECYNDATQSLSFYPFFAYTALNSQSTQCKSYPAVISRELIDQIPSTDKRLELFLIPTQDEIDSFGTSNAAYAADGTTTTKTKGKALKARAQAQFGSKLYSSTKIFAYMSSKYQKVSGAGDGELCIIRSSEMLLNEAEALCMLKESGYETKVQNLLTELNVSTGRDPSFTCTETGDALLAKVKLYRRFDLWCEGHSWLDYKRWGEKIERKSFANGGSFGGQAATFDLTDKHNWCWAYPEEETLYNKQVTALE